jgi:hypothetical protein
MRRTDPNNELAQYLHKRLQYLEGCNAEFNSHLDDKRLELARNLDDGTYRKDDPEIGRILHHLNWVLANSFRYTMLVALCSFLEEAIKEITKRLVSDYDARMAAEIGNWLARHTRLLAEVRGLDLDPIDKDLKTFHDLIALRNCVVHHWGKVAAARDPCAVEGVANRVETADISRDGFLYLGDQVLPEAISAAENIADHILGSQLNVSIT